MALPRRFLAPALGVLLLAALGPAQAMSIRELHALEANEKDGKLYANYYLVGVMEGLRQASDAAGRRGEKQPFCIEGRRLEPSMARALFQGELGRRSEFYEADMPVELVMDAALQGSFRCTH